jgi:hypothetical protein
MSTFGVVTEDGRPPEKEVLFFCSLFKIMQTMNQRKISLSALKSAPQQAGMMPALHTHTQRLGDYVWQPL